MPVNLPDQVVRRLRERAQRHRRSRQGELQDRPATLADILAEVRADRDGR